MAAPSSSTSSTDPAATLSTTPAAVVPPGVPPGVQYTVQNHPDGGYSYQYQYQTATGGPVGYTSRTTRTYGAPTVPVHITASYTPPMQMTTTKTTSSGNVPVVTTKHAQPTQRQESRSGVWSFDAMQKYIHDHFTTPALHDFEFACQVDTIVEVHPPEVQGKQITFRPCTDAMFDSKERQLIICMDLPGFVKEDICIEVENFVLNISGTRKEKERTEKYGENVTMFLRETYFGYFCRSFKLPPNAQENSISASMTSGQLEIKIKCMHAGERKKVEVA